jgi:hypothetical protein
MAICVKIRPGTEGIFSASGLQRRFAENAGFMLFSSGGSGLFLDFEPEVP